MTKRLLTILKKAGPVLFAIFLILVFSAYHAWRTCEELTREKIAPPPYYGMTFVLYPNRHIADAPDLGFKPGWVVTYAPLSKNYGTAFFVPFLGKLRASGTPMMVATQHQEAALDLEKFQRAFATLDTAVQVGTPYRNALTVLGEPTVIMTNADGSLWVHVSYEPRAEGRISITGLTNGFSLLVSNGIIIYKGYSYMSSH